MDGQHAGRLIRSTQKDALQRLLVSASAGVCVSLLLEPDALLPTDLLLQLVVLDGRDAIIHGPTDCVLQFFAVPYLQVRARDKCVMSNSAIEQPFYS